MFILHSMLLNSIVFSTMLLNHKWIFHREENLEDYIGCSCIHSLSFHVNSMTPQMILGGYSVDCLAFYQAFVSQAYSSVEKSGIL